MARNNAYIVLSDILDQLHIEQPGIPDLDHQGQFLDLEAHLDKLNLFPENYELKPETKDRAIKLLCQHFPFLQTEGDLKSSEQTENQDILHIPITYEEKCKSLLDALSILTRVRDENLHYRFNDNRINQYEYRQTEAKTCHLLRLVLKAAPRKVSSKFKHTCQITNDSLDFFRNNQFIKEEKSFRFNANWLFSPQRKPFSSEETVIRFDKLHGIDKWVPVKNDDGTPRLFNRLSLFGEVLLVALFTEKRYIHKFLEACGFFSENGFSPKADKGLLSEQRILKEIISAYSLRLPKRRLDIEMSSVQSMVEIFNELVKCPDELYSVLPEAKKGQFEIQNDDSNPIIMKRYSDRFAMLLLSFIDTHRLFEKVRFHVNSGHLRSIHHGMKEYMDGISRQRIIENDINSFGRIQEIEKSRGLSNSYMGFSLYRPTNDYQEIPLPYITDTKARYVFNGDCIGLSIQGDKSPVITQKNGRIKVFSPQPDCWISRYELPAMGFYLYLNEKFGGSISAEQIIINKVNEYRAFFHDVAEGKIDSIEDVHLPEKEIPKKLLDYLKGKTSECDFQKYKNAFIQAQIAKTEYRLKKFNENLKMVGSKENRFGKRSYVRILPGKLASFLADDIVFLQSFPEGKPEKRLTGQQFSILQGLIATFPAKTEDYCRKAGLLSGDSAHPFLQDVFDAIPKRFRNTLSFYKSYLSRRLSYLRGAIPDNAAFLHHDKVKWQKNKDSTYYTALAQRYLNGGKDGATTGLFLPRGLFYDAIIKTLKENCPEWVQETNNVDHPNIAYCIISYLYSLQDDYQSFYYVYERSNEYPFSKLIASHNEVRGGWDDLQSILSEVENKQGQYYYELEKRISALQRVPQKRLKHNALTREKLSHSLRLYYNNMCKNEKAIRRILVQDIVLFLLARSVYDKSERLLLRKIEKGGDSLMNQRVDIKTVYKGRYIIQQKGVLIKEQGALFRILNDKRIDSLLMKSGLNPGVIINVGDLIKELEQYDRRRVSIISMIQDYEKSVFDRHPEIQNNNRRISFNTILIADKESSQQKKDALRIIRNAFSHNDYPEREVKQNGKANLILYESVLPNMAESLYITTMNLINHSDL